MHCSHLEETSIVHAEMAV